MTQIVDYISDQPVATTSTDFKDVGCETAQPDICDQFELTEIYVFAPVPSHEIHKLFEHDSDYLIEQVL